jgi:hypothetical protein
VYRRECLPSIPSPTSVKRSVVYNTLLTGGSVRRGWKRRVRYWGSSGAKGETPNMRIAGRTRN